MHNQNNDLNNAGSFGVPLGLHQESQHLYGRGQDQMGSNGIGNQYHNRQERSSNGNYWHSNDPQQRGANYSRDGSNNHRGDRNHDNYRGRSQHHMHYGHNQESDQFPNGGEDAMTIGAD